MGSASSGFFSAFRDLPFSARYPDARTPVTSDVLEVGLAVGIGVIFFSLLFAAIIGKGLRDRVPSLVRAGYLLFVGATILVGLYGYGWETGSVKTTMPYKPFTADEVHATLGLHIGLHGINITLKGTPETKQVVGGLNETIDYNEHFDWVGSGWQQGRLGFGSQAGEISQEFLRAQYKGVPLPILWVAEVFTIDGERIRWGRAHLQAGFYTSLLLWVSFSVWILTFILLHSILTHGSVFLLMTGLLQIGASAVFAGTRQYIGPPLHVPIGTTTLTLSFGWSFFLTLLTGISNVFLGIFLYQLDLHRPKLAARLLNLCTVDLNERIAKENGFAEKKTQEDSSPHLMPGRGDIEMRSVSQHSRPSHFRRRATTRLPEQPEMEGDVILREPRKISAVVRTKKQSAITSVSGYGIDYVEENPATEDTMYASIKKTSQQSGSSGASAAASGHTEASGASAFTNDEAE